MRPHDLIELVLCDEPERKRNRERDGEKRIAAINDPVLQCTSERPAGRSPQWRVTEGGGDAGLVENRCRKWNCLVCTRRSTLSAQGCRE